MPTHEAAKGSETLAAPFVIVSSEVRTRHFLVRFEPRVGVNIITKAASLCFELPSGDSLSAQD